MMQPITNITAHNNVETQKGYIVSFFSQKHPCITLKKRKPKTNQHGFSLYHIPGIMLMLHTQHLISPCLLRQVALCPFY